MLVCILMREKKGYGLERVEKWEGDKENWERRNCNQNIIYEKKPISIKNNLFHKGEKREGET